MVRSVWAIIAVALMAVVVTGCQTWRATTASPESLTADPRDDFWRITLRDSQERLILTDVSVAVDSIYGAGEFGPTAVPRDDLSVIEVRRFSLSRTIILPIAAYGLYELFSSFFSGSRVE